MSMTEAYHADKESPSPGLASETERKDRSYSEGSYARRQDRGRCSKGLDACGTRGSIQLLISVLCGVAAVYLNVGSGPHLTLLFGEKPQESLLWWLVSVPLDIYVGIYFLRFLGSFLARKWLKEISQSEPLREATIRLAYNLVQDARVPALVANLMQSPAIVCGVRDLVVEVLEAPQVLKVLCQTMSRVLEHPDVQDAAAQMCSKVVAHDRVARGIDVAMSRETLSEPLIEQAVRILLDARLHSACSEMAVAMLERKQLQTTIRHRAHEMASDQDLVRAGCAGFGKAMVCSGQRHEREFSGAVRVETEEELSFEVKMPNLGVNDL